MGQRFSAFWKGGLGCLGIFIVVGLLIVLIGGHMRIDVGGAILLFAIGGILGLIVLAIFRKGYKRGQTEGQKSPPDDPPGPPG